MDHSKYKCHMSHNLRHTVSAIRPDGEDCVSLRFFSPMAFLTICILLIIPFRICSLTQLGDMIIHEQTFQFEHHSTSRFIFSPLAECSLNPTFVAIHIKYILCIVDRKERLSAQVDTLIV